MILLSCNIFFFRNIDDVDKTMDEINEQTENMKQIQDALSAPIGAAADFDEVILLVYFICAILVANKIFISLDCSTVVVF